jgi:RecA/RadA recombinase
MGYKTLFIDSDNKFSSRRLAQIAYSDFKEVLPSIFLVRPVTFKEQAMAIDHLDDYITKKFRLVVVDTITSLYRVELGEPKENFALNRELSRQVACLAQVAKTNEVATIITGQVRSVFAEDGESVEPVATRVLKFWSDVIIELRNTGQTNVIKAILQKHPERKRPISCYLKIERTGIHEYSG